MTDAELSGLPPGFVLDAATAPTLGADPLELPDGFVLDAPSAPHEKIGSTADFFLSMPRAALKSAMGAISAQGEAAQVEMRQPVEPTGDEMLRQLEQNVTGKMHEPETRAGHYGAAIGGALGDPLTYIGPGGLPVKLAVGAAAALGGEAAGQATEGSNWELPARFAGSLAGGGAVPAAMAGARGVAAVARGARDFAAPLTEGGRERLAAETLGNRATDRGAAIEALGNEPAEIVPGSQPTTFQQSGDMGLGSLEREVATANPADFNQRRAEQNSARVGAVQGLQQTGSPAEVANALRAQLEEIEAASDAAVHRATTQARQAAERIGGEGTPEDYGASLRGSVAEARAVAKQQERALWGAVDPDGSLIVRANGLRQTAREIEGSVSPSARPISGEERDIIDTINGYQSAVPFNEATDLRSRISTAMRAEVRSAGETPSYGRLARLRGAVEGAINSGVARRATQEAEAVARGEMSSEDGILARFQAVADAWRRQRAGQNIGESAPADGAVRAPVVSRLPGGQGEARGGLPDTPGDQRLQPNAVPPASQERLAPAPQQSPGFEVHHGSPHDFDRFSMEHIGSGEGAQSYGHGLYFAENEGVARQYAKTTSERDFIRKARELYDQFDSPSDAHEAIAESKEFTPGQKRLLLALEEDDWLGFDYPHQAVSAALREPKNFDLSPGTIDAIKGIGNQYKVRIKADREHFLDWDKPLSEQSQQVKDALKKAIKNPIEGDPTGEGFIKSNGWGQQQQALVSAKLREAGIPGIKYLDQGSRITPANPEIEALKGVLRIAKGDLDRAVARGDSHQARLIQGGIQQINEKIAALPAPIQPPQTSNFVVFDDKLLDVTHKNGNRLTPKARRDFIAQMREDQPPAQAPQTETAKAPLAGPSDSGSQGVAAITGALDRLKSRGGSAWVEVPEGQIYLRRGQRPDIGATIEVPNVEFDEAARGHGAFGRYLKAIESYADKSGTDAVFVEQIFNPRLAQYLRRNGYRNEPSGPGRFTPQSEQANLYKPIYPTARFTADEPYRLSDGAALATPAEKIAAEALDSNNNRHGAAARDIRELLDLRRRNGQDGGAAGSNADLDKAIQVIADWQKHDVKLAGSTLTEAERDARAAAPTVAPPVAEPPRATAAAPAAAPVELDPQQRLAAASTATRERVATFDKGPIGTVLRSDGMKGQYRTPNAAVPSVVLKPGPQGFERVQAFRRAVGDDAAALATLQDAAAQKLRGSALKADGTVDPGQLARWRKAHAEALRAFPELDARFADAGRASEAIGEAVAARQAALKDFQQGAFGKLIGSTDPEDATKTVGAIFGRQDTVQQMRRLANATAQDPAAREGLRKAIVDHMASKFIGNAESGTSGVGTLKSDQFQTFVRQNIGALRAVFTPEEVANINAVAADLQRSNRSNTAVKLPGGSNTAQDQGPAQASLLNTILRTRSAESVGAAAGAAIGGSLGGPIGAGAGAVAGKVGGGWIANARRAGFAQVDDLIAAALLDPKLGRALLMKAPVRPDTGTERQLGRVLARVGADALLTTVPTSQRGSSGDGSVPEGERAQTTDTAARSLALIKAGQWGGWAASKIPAVAEMAPWLGPATGMSATGAYASLGQLYDETHSHPPMSGGDIARQQRGGLGVREMMGKQFSQQQGTGERGSPVVLETPEDVHHAAEVTAEPSAAQAQAGNYAMRHLRWKGLNLSIETEAGQERTGVGADGKPWSTVMSHPYGYFRGTEGRDGDHLDAYIGPHPNSQRVYIIDQVDPRSGRFDEHKIVIGAASRLQAADVYDAGFSDETGAARRGGITEMSVPKFKAWLGSGDTKKPLAASVLQQEQRAGPPMDLRAMLADPRSAQDIRAELTSHGVLATAK